MALDEERGGDTPIFAMEMEVRDYECDIQGLVNNAVYQNYLEHARHLFIKTLGVDFAAWAARGTNLVVTRVELDYHHPLRSGDRFRVTARMERVSRLRFAFLQEITRLPDGQPVLHGRVIGTGIDGRGRPCLPPEIEELLAQHLPATGEGSAPGGGPASG